MKLAIAQISTNPGDIPGNTKKIIKYINLAKASGAEIVVFPELAIPGYMSLDLMLYPKYVEENVKALKKIAKNSKGILVIVGFIDWDKGKISPDGTPIRYNSAAIIYHQKIFAIQDKTLLPNYDVFFENRYFASGRDRKIVEFKGMNLGIQICEDLWDENYPIKVSEDLVKKGADILINISGSPFYMGKRFDREKLIKKVSQTFKTPFIYINTVGTQDGYDGELVFDGQSMVFNKQGKLLYLGKAFKEELFNIDVKDLTDKNIAEVKLDKFNPTEELLDALTIAISDYFRRTKFIRAFIGFSGGVDSALTAAIAVLALGKENVTGIAMPSQFSSKDSLEDAGKLAKNLGIKMEIITIKNIFKAFLGEVGEYFKGLPSDTTEENIQARIRGMILMAHANKFEGLVISTANKTETALGYTTLYGDMCGAIAPLADVNKLRVYELANFINTHFKKSVIPKRTITKIPSAELRENQTDEQSLGAPYEVISPLVDEVIEGLATREDLAKKYPGKIVDYIIYLISKNEYKRRQAAPGVKVTKKAFGAGRRVPIAHDFKN